MKLQFLGTGAAFIVGNNYQSNMLLTLDNDKKLLLDCGSDIRHSLFAQGYGSKDIDAIYISHLHSDHVGGLEWLGFERKFKHFEKPDLFIHEDLADLLWNNVLKGGMSSLENETATLETYFNVHKIKNNFSFINSEFILVPTLHVIDNHKLIPSFGVMLKYKNKSILITTDAKFDLVSLEKYYQEADIIFHDCETLLIPTGVHAHHKELSTLPSEIKQKMWLYDYNSEDFSGCSADGFLGYVTKGQIFQF